MSSFNVSEYNSYILINVNENTSSGKWPILVKKKKNRGDRRALFPLNKENTPQSQTLDFEALIPPPPQ